MLRTTRVAMRKALDSAHYSLATWGMRNGKRVKITTGITGLAADHNVRGKLLNVYQETVDKCKKAPLGMTEYNASVMQLSQKRIDVINQIDDVEEIEKVIDMGEAEELLDQAYSELHLFDMMNDPSLPCHNASEEEMLKNDDRFREQLSLACGFEWKKEWPIAWPPPVDLDTLEFKNISDAKWR